MLTWVGFAGGRSGAKPRAQFTKRIDLEAEGSGLGPVRDDLSDWLCRQGVCEPDLHRILIAAGEACSYAVDHPGAQRSMTEPPAWIEATADEAAVRVVVTNAAGRENPGPAHRASARASRGRGRLVRCLLMMKLVDHVQIGTGPGGTTVKLIKARPDLQPDKVLDAVGR